MSRPKIGSLLLIAFMVLVACSGNLPETQSKKVLVIAQDMPYPTDKFIRIGYTLKIWEYEKEGLVLLQIVILDDNSKESLLTIEKNDLPKMYKDPIPANPYFTSDKLSHYYVSLQLPVPLGKVIPRKVSHRLLFKNTQKNEDLTIEGGLFSPGSTYTPIVIASPVKGKNWMFINQSTMGYHFNAIFFTKGKMGTGERFAFDNLRFNNKFTGYFQGDPTKNTSYYNYKAPLYAVADGTVVAVRDGLPENSGNAHDVKFNTAIDLAGNYIIMDIGKGRYAFYAHCHTNSIKVKVGDVVKEGDFLALLGNSGNSDAPHLHFQICDAPDFFMSHGLPFVLKKYTKIAEYGNDKFKLSPPTNYFNAMMEEMTVIGFE